MCQATRQEEIQKTLSCSSITMRAKINTIRRLCTILKVRLASKGVVALFKYLIRRRVASISQICLLVFSRIMVWPRFNRCKLREFKCSGAVVPSKIIIMTDLKRRIKPSSKCKWSLAVVKFLLLEAMGSHASRASTARSRTRWKRRSQARWAALERTRQGFKRATEAINNNHQQIM